MRRGVVSVTKNGWNGYFCFRSVEQLPEIAVVTVPPLTISPDAPHFLYASVSQTVVRGPQVVLGFCPCGHFRLNISPKKTEKIKLTLIAYHTL